MSAHLLLVEDDASLAAITRRFLVQAGHRVTVASNGEEALIVLLKNTPDLVISDVQLPGISGIKLCQLLKEKPSTQHVPIILVTVLGKTHEKVDGLRSGADDYLTKPFDAQELLARVESVLRRVQNKGALQEILEVGPIRADVSHRNVTVNAVPIDLRKKEFELLILFLRKPGRLWSRGALLSSLWGEDTVVSPNTLEVHIKNLRSRLGKAGARIETLPGEGYRLRGEI